MEWHAGPGSSCEQFSVRPLLVHDLVKGVDSLLACARKGVQIPGRGANTRVAQPFLDDLQRRPTLQQPRSRGMAKIMHSQAGDACPLTAWLPDISPPVIDAEDGAGAGLEAPFAWDRL